MDKRTVLWYMTFWGFAVNYIVRTNVNIAVVSMVRRGGPTRRSNATAAARAAECSARAVNGTVPVPNVDAEPTSTTDPHNADGFDWDEYQQNVVLGAYSALNVFTQLPGGVLGRRYGSKLVFGLSNGLSALLSFAVPVAAKTSFEFLVAVRSVQGAIAGASWSSMHTMVANWVPAHERGRFVSAYFGSSVGLALTYITCGYLIATTGWESVFYVSGALGLLWIICWKLLVYDTPAEHPTISNRERTNIENCISGVISQRGRSKKLLIPWTSIFRSKAMFINMFAQVGTTWGMFTLATQTPTYLSFVLGLNIKQTGLWSGMPYVFRWLFSFAFSSGCDYLVKTDIVSLTNARKFASGFSNVLHGLFVVGLCVAGCNSSAALVMLFSATVMSGAATSGPFGGAIDLAPNYAGVVQGIISTVTVSTGFISPMVVGFFTYNQQTLSQWNKVFYLSGALISIPGLIYILFGTSKVQKWNTYGERTSIKNEMKPMNENSEQTTRH